jgi:uncharacterized protein (TIGR00730 family)
MIKKTVAFFGSARVQPGTNLYRKTFDAAAYMAAHGWTIATGGGPGLMEAANLGATSSCPNATCSLGYSIYLPTEDYVNEGVQHNTSHDTFFTRLQQFTDECDAFIALPGGFGTLLEVLTVIQLIQVQHIEPKPLVLVGSMWREIMEKTVLAMWQERMIREEEQAFHWYSSAPIDAATRLVDKYARTSD